MRRSLAEYVRELVRGYWSVVVLLLEILGLAAIFWGDTRALHVLGVGGVAVGLLAAPFMAFHRMRVQRDAALQGTTLFPRRLRVANELSLGNWGLDSFASTADDGIAARAMVGARHGVAATAQLDDDLARKVETTLRNSPIEAFLQDRLSNERRGWRLISPTNDWVVTAERPPVAVDEVWEMWARCIVQLPRSFGGVWPVAVADVFIRPHRQAPVPDAQFNAALSPRPEGRARLDLIDVRNLLEHLGATVVEDIAALVFPLIIERRRSERLLGHIRKHNGLRLIGPNYDFRTRPHMLVEALDMPALMRRPGAPNDNRLYAETSSIVDPYAADARRRAVCEGILRSLRQHEYEGAEEFAKQLFLQGEPRQLTVEPHHASGPSPA